MNSNDNISINTSVGSRREDEEAYQRLAPHGIRTERLLDRNGGDWKAERIPSNASFPIKDEIQWRLQENRRPSGKLEQQAPTLNFHDIMALLNPKSGDTLAPVAPTEPEARRNTATKMTQVKFRL